mgnify:CR=1|tara:strand:+ start:2111 stop:2731 length:621 start_codon:yes stop_codon:yes gene_type:complete
MKLTNPKNGQTINSRFNTNSEAVQNLTDRIENGWQNNFAYSLVESAAKKPLSPAQSFWVHKLADDSPQEPTEQGINLDGLRNTFAIAAQNLKRPAMVLNLEDRVLKISLATNRSKYEGQIMIASPSFGEAYYGRVDKDGNFFAGRDSSDSVVAFLRLLSSDPSGVAAKHGRLTGKCCFCNRPLKDERSTSVGYGSTCAKNFGLAWG